MKKILQTAAIVIASLLSLTLDAQQVPASALLKILGNNPSSIQGSVQVVIITGTNSSPYGQLYAFEKVKDSWQTQFIPMWAVIGKKGLVDEAEKTEGDLSTVAGVFPIARAAGTEPAPETGLDYIHWKGGIPGLEALFSRPQGPGMDAREKRSRYTFRYCILLRQKGKEPSPGDGLMLHLWPGQKNYTAGSIGISEINMLKLLKWLDKEKNPVIITGTAASLQTIK